MPRDIPVGNGQMLVTFDQQYQIRDLYFPHVGQENHAGGGPCRFGVWGAVPQTSTTQADRRKKRLFWTSSGWDISLNYQPSTLATDVSMTQAELQVALHCTDVVDFHRPILVRKIEVTNLADHDRVVHLFHHNNFNMYGSKVGDTAYFDPVLRALLHYRTNRYLMTAWYADGEPRMDEFATGAAGFGNAEGTWRDAEDGTLGNNPIAQGSVDSTSMLAVQLAARGSKTVYLVIACGHSYQDMEVLHKFLHRESPQGVIDRTIAYWRLWLGATRTEFPNMDEGGPSPRVVDLFKRSLLLVRTQIDNSGAIIAANDSDIMQFSRDTYSYLWPRDGAMVAASLDDAGFPDVARSFYSLCSRIIDDQGYFLHKYNPDGSPASSWHPWLNNGQPQLPIQEDETALVVWALWRHYALYRDIEFVRPLWLGLITKAADFLVRFRDPDTNLPLPSYDLWEERWGVHAFTVASVYGALQAAHQFAVCFGDTRRAETYGAAAAQTRDAFSRFFWSEERGHFLRRIVPLDHARTARLMAEVMAGRTPASDLAETVTTPKSRRKNGKAGAAGNGNGRNGSSVHTDSPHPTLAFEFDACLDSSLYAIFAMGLLPVQDERVAKTMAAIEQRLRVAPASASSPGGGMLLPSAGVAGIARYENDNYQRIHETTDHRVPGNPWFICTLWLADWKIAQAQTEDELRAALPIFEWVADHALPSGVLAEQVHPHTHAPLSVSPLTWSHATVVSSLVAYLRKLERMKACPTCGQPLQRNVGDPADMTHRNHAHETPRSAAKVA